MSGQCPATAGAGPSVYLNKDDEQIAKVSPICGAEQGKVRCESGAVPQL